MSRRSEKSDLTKGRKRSRGSNENSPELANQASVSSPDIETEILVIRKKVFVPKRLFAVDELSEIFGATTMLSENKRAGDGEDCELGGGVDPALPNGGKRRRLKSPSEADKSLQKGVLQDYSTCSNAGLFGSKASLYDSFLGNQFSDSEDDQDDLPECEF